MARIPYFDLTKATGKAAEVYASLPALNIFKMLVHSGDLLESFANFGSYLLSFTSLDPLLRELAIVRVGVLSKASYEIYHHEVISRRVGVSEALLKAVHEGPRAAAFNDLQRASIAFTDDVVLNVRASDATFLPLRKALGDKALQELTIIIGFYMMVSRFLETYDVDIEDGEFNFTEKLLSGPA